MSLDPARSAVRLGVRRELADLGAATVVVACSGGADSLALTAATVFEAKAGGWRVVGCTVDHGLQDGSDAQARRVVQQMAEIGVDETLTASVTVQAAGQGMEAAAREARYAVLEQVADHTGAGAVLLGHTRDDQAETVLLGLTRGSGGRSIAGMRTRFDRFHRPLLEVTRDQTEDACRADGIEWWEDPHNQDPRFLRARVRHTVLPMLERELGPGIAPTLARTGDLLRADLEALDDLADALGERAAVEGGLLVAALEDQPHALVSRVCRRAALEAGAIPGELAAEHVRGIVALISHWHGQKWVDLPGHLRATRSGGLVTFYNPSS